MGLPKPLFARAKTRITWKVTKYFVFCLAILASNTLYAALTTPNVASVSDHGIPGMYLGTLRTADFTGDGKPDVIMSGHFGARSQEPAEIRIYKNISSGTGDIRFSLLHQYSQSTGDIQEVGNWSGVRLGDYDNDGDMDFFVVFSDGQETTIGTNNGTGNFTLSTLPFIGRHIAVADLNNDGYLEIVTTRGSAPLYYSWDGSSWVAKQNDFQNDICDGGLAIGDLDGDGYKDILVGGNCSGFGSFSSPNQTHSQWHKNNAGLIDSQPSAHLSALGGGSPSGITYGMDNGSYVLDDFDQDGNLDIAFAGSHEGFDGPPGSDWTQYDFFLLFNKDGTGKNFENWQDAEGGAGNTRINGITSGDFNGDGYPDIFFAGHQRLGNYVFQSRLYLNDGTGKMVRVHRGLPHLGRGNGAFADFDGDGRVDLIYHGAEIAYHSNSPSGQQDTNSTSTIKTYVYRNTDGVVDTTLPSTPGGLTAQASTTAAEVTLNWTASSDAESGISRYALKRDGATIANVNGTTYTDRGLQEATTYQYTVVAVNGAGLESSASNTASTTTVADLVSPSIATVTASVSTTVEVVFSEAVTTSSAEMTANYALSPSVTISTASLGSDLRTVTLITTGSLMDGTTYTLSVNNVQDRAASPNSIANGSQLAFTYTAPSGGGTPGQGNYVWGTLGVGSSVYNDRDYTYSSVPTAYVGMNYLQTANDDKFSSGASFLSFDVTEATTVYVGYDTRNTTLPTWLQSWTATTDNLISADATLKIYQKDFAAGAVLLGGNEMGNSMYVVLTSAGVSGGTGTGTGGGSGNTGTGGSGTANAAGDDGGGGAMGWYLILILAFLTLMRTIQRDSLIHIISLFTGNKVSMKQYGKWTKTIRSLVSAVLLVWWPTAHAVNPTLAAIPDNTWVKVQSEGELAPYFGILAYSGMAYDSVNHKLLVFGGGHNDYGGNEVWTFDPETLKWKKMYEPDTESAYVYSNYDPSEPGKLQASGRPLSRHTFDWIDFIDHAGVMVVIDGSTVDSNTGGGELGSFHTGDTWTYDYVSNTWDYRQNQPEAFYEAGGSAYDAGSQLVVAVAWGDTWVYDYDNDQWTERFPAQRPPSSGEIVLEYDSKRGVVYQFAGEWPHQSELWKYDVAINNWQKINTTGATPPAGGGYGLAYDRVNDKLVAIKGTSGTWVFDPVTNAWTQMTPTTGDPVHAAIRTHGSLKYDPVNNVTFFVTFNGNYEVETWAYRYGKGISDTSSPSTPGGLTAQASTTAAEVTLNWTASSDAESGISRYALKRDGATIANVNGTTYTDRGLQEATTYQYTVVAVNGAGLESSASNTASTTTVADLVSPSIATVTASVSTTVEVVFSEAVTTSSAEMTANYALSPSVTISTASLGSDLRTVTLITTGSLMDGTTYTLSVNNVQDRAASPNSIANGSQLAFTYTAPSGGGTPGQGNYVWGTLGVGSSVYNDRDYTYSSVPTAYVGMNYLQTANDDKFSSGASFLSFDVTEATTVYVGYDTRNTTLPTWLQSWTATTDNLISADATLKIYQKDFAAGAVLLGGNEMGNSMYVVLTSAGVSGGTGTGTGGGSGNTGTGGSGTANAAGDDGGGGAVGWYLLVLLSLLVLVSRRLRAGVTTKLYL